MSGGHRGRRAHTSAPTSRTRLPSLFKGPMYSYGDLRERDDLPQYNNSGWSANG